MLKGITPKSHFQVVCEKLGIEVIVAHSPQAKGERKEITIHIKIAL
ncbi:hypothetical protein HMPREF9554_01398 [Treponema phagedenis F0421]|nr:hypothetical protein HMPREF9554_01398 [Treponema phagedenis F0421]